MGEEEVMPIKIQMESGEDSILKTLEEATMRGKGETSLKGEDANTLVEVVETDMKLVEADAVQATKAAIEQAKTAAEETVENIEAVLVRGEGSLDVSNGNGSFVQLDIVDNGGQRPTDKTPKKRLKKILKWFQCTVL